MRISSLVWLIAVSLWSQFVSPTAAQSPSLVVTLPDTTLNPGATYWLPIYLQNFDDAVAGVQFTIVCDSPQTARFYGGAGMFDTTGTLMSGWELVDGYDTSGIGTSLTLYGLANTLPDNHINTPPIPAYGGGPLVPLIRIPVTTSDSLSQGSQTASLRFDGLLEFSTPEAELIGVVTTLVIDTLYLNCVERLDDSCLEWAEVDPHVEPFDSVAIDSNLVGYIDSTDVVGQNGSITVLQTMGCDVTLDNQLTLTDLTCLVQFLFNQNRPPACLYYGNCNFGDPGVLNLTDVVGLVNHLFYGGPPPQ